jgi:hypothetical protein
MKIPSFGNIDSTIILLYYSFFILFRIPTTDPYLKCNDKNIFELDINEETGLGEKEGIAEGEYEDELPLEEKEEAIISVETEQINLGTEEEPQKVRIAIMPEDKKRRWIQFLMEYKTVFAWSYQDMPGLDPEIASHRLPIKSDHKPVKQKLRRMKPELAGKVKEEIDKLLQARFIEPINYTEWLANIVVVPKKNQGLRRLSRSELCEPKG